MTIDFGGNGPIMDWDSRDEGGALRSSKSESLIKR